MPYPVLAGSIAALRIQGTLDGQTVMCTWHYQCITNTVDGAGSMASALTDFEQQVWVRIRPGVSIDLEEVILIGQYVHTTRRPAVGRLPAGRKGLVNSDACTSGTAIVVRRMSEQVGPSHRGRVYIPAPAFADTEASEMGAAWMAGNAGSYAVAMYASLTVDAVPDAWKATLWNPALPLGFTLLTGGIVDPILRYQRRREIGVGI